MTDPKLTPREPTPSMVEAGLVWTDFARGVWRAMHDAAPSVEVEPVAWMDDFGNAFPLAANKGAGSWLDEHKRNWTPLYTHPAAPQPAARRADGMPASADERHLRRMLAARVGMQHTYFDDGEAQGQEHGIAIDFMRQPVADIDAMLRALNVARYECAAPPPVERAHGIEEVKR